MPETNIARETRLRGSGISDSKSSNQLTLEKDGFEQSGEKGHRERWGRRRRKSIAIAITIIVPADPIDQLSNYGDWNETAKETLSSSALPVRFGLKERKCRWTHLTSRNDAVLVGVLSEFRDILSMHSVVLSNACV
ncbi:hypothetical protein CRG98_035618 [Punica granatum]|uniref:Uncharacterized protein n=1 Tax=Punica granatum TaxID=22663 RepID=A0A2I0IIZ3_PUNGR|nr:hypothetical protein CRG98_035618 [Punica granatum]